MAMVKHLVHSILRIICLMMLTLTATSCASDDLSMARGFDLPTTGPTRMNRVPGGYELINRQVRVVIDERHGHLVYWGSVDGRQNLLDQQGVEIHLVDVKSSLPEGYIEKRDDQTWQYIGDDPQAGVRWRRIYCLEGLSLLATFIVQNTADQPLDTLMLVRAHLAEPGPRRIQHADLFTMQSPLGMVSIRGFREHPFTGTYDQPSATLLSDRFQLQPGERYSFTTEWRLDVTFGSETR